MIYKHDSESDDNDFLKDRNETLNTAVVLNSSYSIDKPLQTQNSDYFKP